MQQVTLDQATLERLHNLAEMLEIRDQEGRVLGYFSPVLKQDRPLYAGAYVPVTDEEVQNLLKQPPGRPLADILADLEKLP
jgi:hypothetical protein